MLTLLNIYLQSMAPTIPCKYRKKGLKQNYTKL